jgi:hypothetical protein
MIRPNRNAPSYTQSLMAMMAKSLEPDGSDGEEPDGHDSYEPNS